MTDKDVPEVARSFMDLTRPSKPRFPIPPHLIPLAIDTNKPKREQLSIWAMNEMATGNQTPSKKSAKKLNLKKLETQASPSPASLGHSGGKGKPGKNLLPADQALPAKPEPSEIPSQSLTQIEPSLAESGSSIKNEKGAVLTKQVSLAKLALTEGLELAEEASPEATGDGLKLVQPAMLEASGENLELVKSASLDLPEEGLQSANCSLDLEGEELESELLKLHSQRLQAAQASSAQPGSSGKELKLIPQPEDTSEPDTTPKPEDLVRPAAMNRPINHGLCINPPAGIEIGALIQETGGLIYDSQPCRSLTEADNAAHERIDLDESEDRGVTRMHLDAYHGNLVELEQLIQYDSGVLRKRDVRNGFTPIFYAIAGNSEAGAIYIIKCVGDSDAGESPGIKGGVKGLLRARSNRGYTPLGLACCLGKTQVAESLIECGADIKMRTDNLNSMLHLAAENGNLVLVKLFLQAGLHVNTINIYNMTPLHYAVFFSHAEVVECLLAKGANVNHVFGRELEVENKFGLTSLMLAAFNGNVKITKILLDARANLKMVDEYGMTALQLAAENGHLEVVDMLLEANSKIGGQGKDLLTAVHRAIIYDHTDVVTRLLKNCSLEFKNLGTCNGSTALHMAARYGYMDTVTELLNEMFIKMNIKDADRCTPLMIAIKFSHEEVVFAILAKKSVSVNLSDTIGYTPLHLAAYTGCSVAVVRELINRGAEKDAKGYKDYEMGITPLHVAVYRGHKHIVRTLLDLGADISLTNPEQWTALHMCAAKGFTDIANILLDHGASIDARSITGSTPLMVAVDTGRMEVVTTLIDRGANINAADVTGYTALHFAAERGYVVAAISLATRGARLEERTVDMRATPLYLAAKNGHPVIVNELLNYNVDTNQMMKYDMTPLHVAVENCHLNVVRSLISSGALIDPIANFNDERYVPLDYAKTSAHTEIKNIFISITNLFQAVEINNLKMVQQLLSEFTLINCRSHKHGTALLLAAKKGYHSMTAYLVDKGSKLDQFDVKGMSPLHYAVQHNWYTLMLLMLRRGANFDQVYKEGCPTALEIDVRTIEVGPLDPLQMEERDKILWFMKTLKKAFAMADKGNEEVLNLIQTVRDRNNWEFLVMMKARRSRNIQLIDAASQAGHIALAIKLSDLKKEAELGFSKENEEIWISELIESTLLG